VVVRLVGIVANHNMRCRAYVFWQACIFWSDGVVRARISVTQTMFHNVYGVYARAETRSITRKMSRAAALVSLDVVMAKDFLVNVRCAEEVMRASRPRRGPPTAISFHLGDAKSW